MKRILGGILLASTFLSCNQQKTAYVNTEKIVKEYKTMANTQDKYAKMNDALMAELEQKAKAYQTQVEEYQKNQGSMSSSQREKAEQDLMSQRQQLQQEQQMRGRQIQQESQAAIDSIIKEVKDEVKSYGESNGYDFIYGQNDAGSIMYGKEEYDVTEEVIAALNKDTKDSIK
ncbi:OmpH family outer membrane protein [Flavimarina sp. Hel_I_48]|uniref:OmpH family outer membrane protein n=1 Tax=Flavimarina sp. Hel_I_48 TaxID=1392488 RepID=UPI0004DF928B|nr:OmpH family outer membrane protein [Flavimarina sp. Hel_I_48]